MEAPGTDDLNKTMAAAIRLPPTRRARGTTCFAGGRGLILIARSPDKIQPSHVARARYEGRRMAEIIEVACPECGKEFQVPASAAGKKVRCKVCGEVIPVTGPPVPP